MKRRIKHLAVSLTLLLAPAIGIDARAIPLQAVQPSTPPAFDVASIRLHTPLPYEGNMIWSSPTNGNFRATNVTLKALIEYAFDMPQSRIVDAPSWTSSRTFDIDAKSGDALNQRLHALPTDQAKPIKLAAIQSLLGDRFGLKTHREQRQMPIYQLVIAKGGPKLSPSKFDGRLIHRGADNLNAQGITLPIIAQELSRDTGRVVIDKTNLPGRFDIDLRWQSDETPPGEDTALPSLFTALQEQLGLRLESAKGPVDVLVIDAVHQPTAN